MFAKARVLRRNLFVDAQVFLDFGYAREKVVDFFCKPGITGALLFQPFDAAVNHRDLGSHVAQAIMSSSELINHFLFEIVDARIELRNILLRRHVLDEM